MAAFWIWITSITDKLFSARFVITVMFGLTYSHIVWHVVHAYLGAMSKSPELLEAFATGVFTGFSGLAVLVVKSYFDRSDRDTPASAHPDAAKPAVASPAPVIKAPPKDPAVSTGNPAFVRTDLLLLAACLFLLAGCASYNQKAVCLQLGTTNASIPYVGGATNGSGYACYVSCLGSKCPTPESTDITGLMANELTASNNSIITSGPVKVTATPLK